MGGIWFSQISPLSLQHIIDHLKIKKHERNNVK
jgi:vacuolar-type H+-ATPase subunit C/Vma6